MTASVQPKVYAVVVSTGIDDSLYSVLQALATQTTHPSAVVVVTVGNSEERIEELSAYLTQGFGDRAWIVKVDSANNFGHALRQALTSDSFAIVPSWYWFLHDDSCPAPAALEELLIQGDRGGTIGLVGPKQVDWDNTDYLLEVGIEATRSGRRAQLSSEEEIDQGQYDHRQDVLAVGTAGMLVRGDIWQQTRGLDPHLGPFGDGLEFGRRLRRAGYRVVVAPKAKVAHKQNSLTGDAEWSPSYRQRRQAQLYNWLVAVSPLSAVAIFLCLAVWTPIRALGRILTRRPRLAIAEIGAYFDLFVALPAIGKARRRHRRIAEVPRTTLKSLEMSAREFSARRREQKRVIRSRPQESEQIDQAATLARMRYRRLSTGVVWGLTLLALLISVFVWYPYLGGLSGPAWANLPNTWSQLWDQAWSAWVLGGDGATGPVNPLLPVWAIFSWPFSLVGIGPTQVAIGFMVLAFPLAILSGWLLTTQFTRSIPINAAGACLWAMQPVLLLSLSEANLSATMALAVMPLIWVALWRATRTVAPWKFEGVGDYLAIARPDPITWGAIGALILLFASSGIPGLTVVVMVVGYLLALTPGRGLKYLVGSGIFDQTKLTTPSGKEITDLHLHASMRQRLLAVSLLWIPAAILTLPTLVQASRYLFGFEGNRLQGINLLFNPTAVQETAAPTVLSLFEASPVPWEFSSVGGFIVLAWALLALIMGIRGKQSFTIERFPAILGAFLVGSVFLVGGAFLALFGQEQSQLGEVIYPWSGGMIAIAVLAWMITGLNATPNPTISSRKLWDHPTNRTLAVPLVAGLAVFLSFVTVVNTWIIGRYVEGESLYFGSQLEVSTIEEIPLVALEAQSSPRAGRLLILQEDSEQTRAQLWRGDGLQQMDLSWGLRNKSIGRGQDDTISDEVSSQQSLAEAIGSIAARPSSQVASTLAEHAVELVLLPSGSSTELGSLYSNLDASEGFERIGSTDKGTMWRVRPDGQLPARAILRSGGNSEVVSSGQAVISTDMEVSSPAELVLAENADSNWVAYFDGQKLDSVTDSSDWRQIFAVPSGQGTLTVSYQPVWQSWWLAALALSSLVVVICALPWRPRRRLWIVFPQPEILPHLEADSPAEENSGQAPDQENDPASETVTSINENIGEEDA